MIIYKLKLDFLEIESVVYKTYLHVEALAIFKEQGVYCLLGFNLTGWKLNDNYYISTTNLRGPWTSKY